MAHLPFGDSCIEDSALASGEPSHLELVPWYATLAWCTGESCSICHVRLGSRGGMLGCQRRSLVSSLSQRCLRAVIMRVSSPAGADAHGVCA